MLTTLAALAVVFVIALAAASARLARSTYEVEGADEELYADLGGTMVRYRVLGSGPPVVMLHGILSSGRVWRLVAAYLSRSFTVYSVDLMGFGDSDKPLSGYGARQSSRLVYAFCERFNLSRVAVVGHGFGGGVAARVAADHPGVVSRVALVAAPSEADQIDLPTPLWLATLPVVGPLFFGLLRLARPWRRLALGPFVKRRMELLKDLIEDAAKSTPAALVGTLSAFRRELAGERLLRQARGVEVPALAVSGEEDRVVDPRCVEDWAATIPGAQTYVLEDCGHLPMIEAPEDLAELLVDFLSGDLTTAADGAPDEEARAGEEGSGADHDPEEERFDEREEREGRGG